MKSRFFKIVTGIIAFAVIVDVLVMRIITILPMPGVTETIFTALHISLSIVFYVVVLKLYFDKNDFRDNVLKNKHYGASGMAVLFYVPKMFLVAFNGLEEILWALYLGVSAIANPFPGLPRIYYLTYAGVAVAIYLFASILFGILWGKFFYQVKHVRLSSPAFPEKLNAFKLVQISDFHIGSFHKNPKQVTRAIQKINQENPDMICFTGDLVNFAAEEALPFVSELQKLKAPYGKYAILGNHDYGEYFPWKSEEEWQDNLKELKSTVREAGFKLLLNQTAEIRKDDQKFVLAGVENWGLPPFPQYGDLESTMNSIGSDEFVVLLSHDPTHWDAQAKKYPNIFLTMSGHTHAMQFGIAIGKWKWSPVKWKYKKWAGLYSEKNQYLYVNKGIGFIGFPGRVGMYPEITVFHLTKTAT